MWSFCDGPTTLCYGRWDVLSSPTSESSYGSPTSRESCPWDGRVSSWPGDYRVTVRPVETSRRPLFFHWWFPGLGEGPDVPENQRRQGLFRPEEVTTGSLRSERFRGTSSLLSLHPLRYSKNRDTSPDWVRPYDFQHSPDIVSTSTSSEITDGLDELVPWSGVKVYVWDAKKYFLDNRTP